MFPSFLVLSLATLTSSAFALPAASESLVVSVKPIASAVESIDQLSFLATVSNPTSKDVSVLKYGTLLDNLPTRSFVVTKDGKEVDFTGIRVSVDLDNKDAYVTIPAGGTVSVNHTLGALYDFESAGTGTFSFTPSSRFSTTGERTSGSPIQVAVTKNVAKKVSLEARLSTPSCSDGGRQQYMADTLTEARALAGGAATDIMSHPTSSQFRTYFGNNAWNTPWYNFDRIAGDLASSGTRTLSCTDPRGACTGGVVAYTLVGTSNGQIVSSDIFFCNVFFTSFQPTNNVCSGTAFNQVRGNVMLHELTHAVAGTLDTVYGCSGSAALSDAQKLTNADNYACMGLQIKRDYAC